MLSLTRSRLKAHNNYLRIFRILESCPKTVSLTYDFLYFFDIKLRANQDKKGRLLGGLDDSNELISGPTYYEREISSRDTDTHFRAQLLKEFCLLRLTWYLNVPVISYPRKTLCDVDVVLRILDRTGVLQKPPK